MAFFYKRGFPGALLFFSIFTFGQPSMFVPYDCRDEVEIMSRIEKEKQLREIAYQDSIEKVQQYEAFLLVELEKQMREDSITGWKHWVTVDNYTFGKNRGGMPMITDVQALHPYFRDKVLHLIRKCEAKGIQLAIVETYRTHAKQSEYKNMGRKYTRSGAGKSKHQYGLAIDVVPIVNGEAQWHNKQLWYKIGVIGEQVGLHWGGRWRSLYDPGHFEWTGGLSSIDLAKGKLPFIPNKESNYPCIEHDLHVLSRYWEQWETEQASYASKHP
jgi:hypothetical protein